MILKDPIRRKIKSGEVIYGQLLLELFTPGIPQILKNCGLDFVLLDMEHGRCDLKLAEHLIISAKNAGISPIVRVPDIEFRPLSRVLDLGASGVMVPRVESSQEMEHIVAQLKYAPEGRRGVALGVAHDNYCAMGPGYFKSANEHALVIALLETCKAFENLESILSTPGLDVAWMGHYDLTVSMGIPAEFDNPKFLEQMDRLLDGCERHGVAPGFLPANPADSKRWIQRGFRVISLGTDVGVYRTALQDFRDQLR